MIKVATSCMKAWFLLRLIHKHKHKVNSSGDNHNKSIMMQACAQWIIVFLAPISLMQTQTQNFYLVALVAMATVSLIALRSRVYRTHQLVYRRAKKS